MGIKSKMNYSVIKRITIELKNVPKSVLVVATILPWGLTILWLYIVIKSTINNFIDKND